MESLLARPYLLSETWKNIRFLVPEAETLIKHKVFTTSARCAAQKPMKTLCFFDVFGAQSLSARIPEPGSQGQDPEPGADSQEPTARIPQP